AGAALSGPGVFESAIDAEGEADCPPSHELCGCDEPYTPRPPELDQAGQGLRLRCAGLVLRCPAGSLPGTPPAPWPRGPGRYHAQDGKQVEGAGLRGGLLENHRRPGETERGGGRVEAAETVGGR